MLKKILAIACTLFMLAGMSAFALEADTVLYPTVRNGDFSNTIEWEWYGSSGAKIANVTEGDYAGAAVVSKGYAVQEVDFDFEPGMSYTLEVKACGPNGAAGFLEAYSYTGWVSLAKESFTLSTAWETYAVTFTVPDKLEKLGIHLGVTSSESVYFDDVKLYETPLISNGDFELGAWDKNGTCELSADSAKAQSGNNCMYFSSVSGNPNIYKEITLKPNTNYELSFWFKYKMEGASIPGRPDVTICSHAWHETEHEHLFSADEYLPTAAPFPGTENTWIKCTYSFKTGDSVVSPTYLNFYGGRSACSYYDTIELKEDKTKTMIHETAGIYGTDVTTIKTLPANTTLYAKGRFIPKSNVANATLVAVVFDEATGTKVLTDIKVVPYSTTTGAATTLQADVTLANPATSAVEVYLWDSTTGLTPLLKKVRTSAGK